MSEGRNTELVSSWREAMEGVTPGPWRSTGGYLTVRDPDSPGFTLSIYHLDEMGQKSAGAMFQAVPFHRSVDASWIARCSPSGVSALLDALESTSRALSEKEGELSPYRDELLKIAADVGEADDPFAAWEAVQAITRQRDEALAALKASEERGWQPIESAPRDGTLILVPGRYGIATPACWWPAAHLEADHTLRGDWDDGERNEDGGFSPFYPTHWMPLPEPPASSGPNLADATKKDPGTEQREAGV